MAYSPVAARACLSPAATFTTFSVRDYSNIRKNHICILHLSEGNTFYQCKCKKMVSHLQTICHRVQHKDIYFRIYFSLISKQPWEFLKKTKQSFQKCNSTADPVFRYEHWIKLYYNTYARRDQIKVAWDALILAFPNLKAWFCKLNILLT